MSRLANLRSTARTTAAALASVVAALSLVACAAGPVAPTTLFDLGPARPAAPATQPTGVALVLAPVDAVPLLDGTGLTYRLLYANAQSPRPYAQARWAMPPPQLLRERLKARLGAERAVLQLGEVAPWTLRVELEDFSQSFDSPQASRGVVRLRATLLRGTAFAAQRVFAAERPAPSADSAGGAAAIAQASDAVVDDIATWVAQVAR